MENKLCQQILWAFYFVSDMGRKHFPLENILTPKKTIAPFKFNGWSLTILNKKIQSEFWIVLKCKRNKKIIIQDGIELRIILHVSYINHGTCTLYIANISINVFNGDMTFK